MKHAFRLSRVGAVAALALAVLCGASLFVGDAQTNVASTPDPFIVQLTTSSIPAVGPATPTPTPSATPTPSPGATPSPTPTPLARLSHAADIDGSGRFVVIESNGDIATERTPHVRNAQGQITTRGRNNEDGNQEIFLLDYAQRRIFQITDTTHALINPGLSPIASINIDVEIVNLRPQISRDGRFIVFISNAYVDGTNLLPNQFDGQPNVAGLRLDANTEIFLYEIPQPAPADLESGEEVPLSNLAGGRMTRITNTPAQRRPSPGALNVAPFFSRDNDAPSVSDDTQAGSASGVIVAFTSRARAGNAVTENADGNSEVVIFQDTNLDVAGGGSFLQVTDTEDVPQAGQPLPRIVFNLNPSLSGDGRRVAFWSNADAAIPGPAAEEAANQGNDEIYLTGYNPATNAVFDMRRVTSTPPLGGQLIGAGTNLLSPGKRLSTDGNMIAFESFAVFGDTGGATTTTSTDVGIYVFYASENRIRLVAARPPDTQIDDIGPRWPTFTYDNSRVVWSSLLNLRTDGTVANVDDATGLNPSFTAGGLIQRPVQIFSAPVNALNQVSRLTRMRGSFNFLQPFPSNTIERMAFTSSLELGGGNSATGDNLPEAFYVFFPRPDVAASPSPTPAAVSFLTGASERPVVAASPAPSPSPAVTGLAPGMLGIGRSATLTLAPETVEVSETDAHETRRRPPLPVELAGVSVSVNDAAAGLYFVGPNQINFVVPPGLAASTTPFPVVISNNGTLIRTTLLLNAAQPDIFTTANGPGGRAVALNVTNPCITPPGEPFNETSTRPVGSATTGSCNSTQTETVPTELMFIVTGVRNVQPSQVTVRIGTTDLTGAAILSVRPSQTPGFDQIVVRLPASLNNAGDVPVVITVNMGAAGTFSSRPAATAPHITIN